MKKRKRKKKKIQPAVESRFAYLFNSNQFRNGNPKAFGALRIYFQFQFYPEIYSVTYEF